MKGSASDSILRWGCACQTQVLCSVGATQPWWEVALLSLSPISVLHSLGPTIPLGPFSLSDFSSPLCPLLPPSAGSSLLFLFLQGADSLPLSLPSFCSCQALWHARVPTKREISHRALLGLFSLAAGPRLPLALSKRGLGVGLSGEGVWLWAAGKARCRWPQSLGTIKGGCQESSKSTCSLSHCGLGSV